jgi:hypothetical protein
MSLLQIPGKPVNSAVRRRRAGSTQKSAPRRPVEEVLRELAFVLHATQVVRGAMSRTKPEGRDD